MDLMTLFHVILLGIVEGLTEFIPVSSTGHLLIAERLLGFRDPGGVFTVVIQLGAILAVCLVYRTKLLKALLDLPKGDGDGLKARRFALAVGVATLPGVIIGLPADKVVEHYVFTPINAPFVVATTFLLGGVAILWIESRRHRSELTDATDLPWKIALGIGLCQILAAVFPGTSRSGATIMGALLMGVSRSAAAEFSFFLAIPAMCGGSLLKLVKHHHDLTHDRLAEIGVGFIVSFLVAWLVVVWLIKFVQTHDFKAFGWYRIAAGALIVIALAAGWLPKPVEEPEEPAKAAVVAPAAAR